MDRAVCSSTDLLAIAEKQVVVIVGAANGVASGLRFEVVKVAELTVGWMEGVAAFTPDEFEQIEKWCLPPHFKYLDLDLHSLLMCPRLRQTKQQSDFLNICFLALSCTTDPQESDGCGFWQ